MKLVLENVGITFASVLFNYNVDHPSLFYVGFTSQLGITEEHPQLLFLEHQLEDHLGNQDRMKVCFLL